MRSRLVSVALIWVVAAAACSSGDGNTLRVYSSVTQGTVDSVVEGFGLLNPDVAVEVFRAPTGELAGRIAAEQREGGLVACFARDVDQRRTVAVLDVGVELGMD